MSKDKPTVSVNPLVIEIERLRAELAEERKHYAAWRLTVNGEHQKQLAAEREALRWEKQEHAKAWEKVQTLVDALKKIHEVALKTDWDLAKRIDTALAKVVEL